MDKIGEKTLLIMNKAGWYNSWLLGFFSKYIKGEILEVGCGSGNFSYMLSHYGSLTSIDINYKYINKLKQNKSGIDFGIGNIETNKYFFKSKKFDSIVCLNVLEHINNDTGALKNIFNLLKPEGRLILLVPAHKILFSSADKLLGHYRRYSKDDLLIKLDKAGFEFEKIQYFNWWGAIGWLIFVKLLNRKIIPRSEVGIFNMLGKFLLWPEKYIRFPFGLSVLAIARKD